MILVYGFLSESSSVDQEKALLALHVVGQILQAFWKSSTVS